MKILQVTNRFYPSLGGVETHVLEISKRFVNLGHEVTVISSDFKELAGSEKYSKQESSGQVFGINFKRFWSFRIFGIDASTTPVGMFFWLLWNIRKYDVVHSHTYGYMVGWLPVLIGKLFRKKVVFTPHYSDGAGVSPVIKKIFDTLIASWEFCLVDWVIALTSIEKKVIQETYGAKNVAVVPNGITPIDKTNYLSKKEVLTKLLPEYDLVNKKIIFSIGRLDKRKGHIFLIKAMEEIEKERQDIFCIIYGSDWGEYQKLFNYIQENNIKNVVILKDISQDEKHNLLEIADVFVLVSLQEAFGIVYLEAMQHGVACVGTNIGAIQEVIPQFAGTIAQVEDVKSTKDAIIYELDNKDTRKKEDIINYAIQYDWDIVVKKIINSVYLN